MRPTKEKEIEAVLRLSGAARFEHFIKRIVDAESAWGLWKDGWALMENDDGKPVLPLWPAREYAELCRDGEWVEYRAKEIPLKTLQEDLLPKLQERGVLPGVFPIPKGKGVATTIEELNRWLNEESEKYA